MAGSAPSPPLNTWPLNMALGATVADSCKGIYQPRLLTDPRDPARPNRLWPIPEITVITLEMSLCFPANEGAPLVDKHSLIG